MGWFVLKLLLFANTDWYLYNFEKSLAAALRDGGHRVILVSPPGPYGAKLRSLGFDWVAAPMDRGSLNPFRELTLLAWLWNFMQREQPDIVHSFTIKCAVYGALTGRLVGARCVSAVAGMGYVFTNNELKARVLRPPLRALMRAALGGEQARLVLQNPDDVHFFEQSNIAPRERIRLICGAGVDCSRFVAPSEAPTRAEGAIRVVLAARMLWDKGVAEFVEAARMLKDENRSVHFLLAGAPDEGNPAAVPERKLREWQAEGLVQWLGHVGDMPALLASVDIVVLPSYREGLPTILIEAAACARALVTTDAPGCREVVTHEIDGLLVPVGDTKALASAIARLQDQPEFAQRLGKAARKKALSKFDEQIVIAQTFAVYEELAAQ
ncbi:glycosyltransferase family 4 protein [Methylosinus sp. Sm6]|uniref:glycosyltransferase family 4 protein n=1 Tax=Methylosinus sp. Sm6 TaxID=2866948 RepID=UPI001C99CB9E|nr:glycosyltransferase family 4 protein [Methylosinus sp. Sm6]MBY6242469.1 glycosyltransferase family 4 protein [Methylosinus sp. Sm6]